MVETTATAFAMTLAVAVSRCVMFGASATAVVITSAGLGAERSCSEYCRNCEKEADVRFHDCKNWLQPMNYNNRANSPTFSKMKSGDSPAGAESSISRVVSPERTRMPTAPALRAIAISV